MWHFTFRYSDILDFSFPDTLNWTCYLLEPNLFSYSLVEISSVWLTSGVVIFQPSYLRTENNFPKFCFYFETEIRWVEARNPSDGDSISTQPYTFCLPGVVHTRIVRVAERRDLNKLNGEILCGSCSWISEVGFHFGRNCFVSVPMSTYSPWNWQIQ